MPALGLKATEGYRLCCAMRHYERARCLNRSTRGFFCGSNGVCAKYANALRSLRFAKGVWATNGYVCFCFPTSLHRRRGSNPFYGDFAQTHVAARAQNNVSNRRGESALQKRGQQLQPHSCTAVDAADGSSAVSLFIRLLRPGMEVPGFGGSSQTEDRGVVTGLSGGNDG